MAEGVETADQLTVLERHRCERVQGYLFFRPIEADEVPPLLHEQSVDPVRRAA